MMSNKMKKIFTFVTLLVLAVSMASCKSGSDYKYPDKTPSITNPDATFVGLDSWKVTNNEAYVKLVNSYGYDAVLEWIDKIIYGSVNEAEFNKYLDKQIYGTDDVTTLSKKEKATALADFEKSMKEMGLETEAQYKDYYKVLFNRQQNAKAKLVEEKTEFDKLVVALEKIDFDKLVTADLDLPVKDGEIEISWASDSKYVVVKDDTLKVTRGQYDVDVTLTATAKTEKFNTTATYKFTVPSKSSTTTSTEKAEKAVVGYYTDATYEGYLNTDYQANVKTVIVTFDSDNEAKSLLKSLGVDVLKLKGQKWTDAKTNTVLTEAEVKEVFVKLYNATKGTTYTFDEIVKEYTYSDLAKFNSTVATKVYSLKALNSLEDGEDYTKCYTVMPTAFGSKYFLAFNVEKGTEVKLEDVKDEITNKILDSRVTSAQINLHAMEKILDSGTLHIYDEGLENQFITKRAAVYSAATVLKYDEYARTTGVSDKNVVSYEYNGVTHTLTADELFTMLVKRYGASLAVTYLSNYAVLANSKTVNVATKAVLDQKAYDKAYKTVTTYKKNFEKGQYVANGYPKAYGWTNFLRDYLGITSEFDLLIANDGVIYKDALDEYQKTLYTHESVLTEAKKIYDEYFKVTLFSVSAWVDEDDNGEADSFVPEVIDADDILDFNDLGVDAFWAKYSEKYTEYTDVAELTDAKNKLERMNEMTTEFVNFLAEIVEASYAKNLDATSIVNKYYSTKNDEEKAEIKVAVENIVKAVATDKDKSIDRYNDLMVLYNIANATDVVFGQFKVKGLQATIASSSSYTNTSNLDQHVKDQILGLYNEALQYQAEYKVKLVEGKDPESVVYGTDLTGKDLDYGYRYTHKVSGSTTEDTYVVKPFESNVFYNVDRSTKVIVTIVNDRTKLSKAVENLLDAEGNVVLDEAGAKVQTVKYYIFDKKGSSDSNEFLTEENYQKYLLDSDDDDKTSSGFTSTEKSVMSTYYAGAIANIVSKYESVIATKLVADVDASKVTLNSNVSKDLVKALLADRVEE